MANLDLEHYKARLKAITPAPWHVTIRGFVPLVFAKGEQRMPIAVVKEVYMSKDERIANANFIAEAPTMVQALVERVEELERQAKAKDEALKQIAGLRPDISDRSAAIEIAQNALKSSEVQG